MLPLAIVAIASLVGGLWGGLARLGWPVPSGDGGLMFRHGGVMVIGFLATVIAIERAIAVRGAIALTAPVASAAAGLSLLAGWPAALSVGLAGAAAVAYAITIGRLWWGHPEVGSSALLAGAISLFVAAVVWWVTGRYAGVVVWWMTFLVLTVGGERLELTRFQRTSAAGGTAGVAAFLLVLVGPAVSLIYDRAGTMLLGVGMVGVAAWSVVRDPARRTVRAGGVARLAGVGVLTAYAWLATSGMLLLTWGLVPGLLGYDAVLHSFFTGFVFAASIAHEPLIAPAITGATFEFSRWQYAPLVMLGGGLVTRIVADASGEFVLRRWSGLVQVGAIALFLVLTIRSFLLGCRTDAQRLSGAKH